MKTILPPIFFLLSIVNLSGQRHAFGVAVGLHYASFQATPILHEEAQFSFDNDVITRPYVSFFFRHQLTEKIALEIAPSVFQERYNNQYNETNDSFSIASQNLFHGILLYSPISLRFDLGHQLFLSLGGGGSFFLSKHKALPLPENEGRLLEEREKQVFKEAFNNITSWPINAEVGLSYGFGRININGKFVYRISSIYGSVSFAAKSFSVDFNTNYLQIGCSYQLGKVKKNNPF